MFVRSLYWKRNENSSRTTLHSRQLSECAKKVPSLSDKIYLISWFFIENVNVQCFRWVFFFFLFFSTKSMSFELSAHLSRDFPLFIQALLVSKILTPSQKKWNVGLFRSENIYSKIGYDLRNFVATINHTFKAAAN